MKLLALIICLMLDAMPDAMPDAEPLPTETAAAVPAAKPCCPNGVCPVPLPVLQPPLPESTTTLYYFTSQRCGPCRTYADPFIKRAFDAGWSIYTVGWSDDDPEEMTRWGVTMWPTFQVRRDEVEVARHVGHFGTYEEFEDWMRKAGVGKR
jgi:hypothetical protein